MTAFFGLTWMHFLCLLAFCAWLYDLCLAAACYNRTLGRLSR